jgi:hypothetical protein
MRLDRALVAHKAESYFQQPKIPIGNPNNVSRSQKKFFPVKLPFDESWRMN